MLRALRIQNFALIEALDLSFNEGFTAVTGETGSGKSILLGALNLILGERSDFSLIGPSGDKAIVEVDYELNVQWESFFTENDLDFEHLTTIRREILSSGKSRAFINDTPVALSVLKALSIQLVSIHSQYNTLELKNTDYQLELLDTLAQLNAERSAYEKLFYQWKSVSSELEQLKAIQRAADQRLDYLNYQLSELVDLQLDSVNYSELEAEFYLLESAEEIQRLMQSLTNGIDGDDGISDRLAQLTQSLSKHAASSEELAQLADRLKSTAVELSDIAKEANRFNDRIEQQPHRLVELEDKINRYNHVLRKHHVTDQQALINVFNQFDLEMSSTTKDLNRIDELEKQLESLHIDLLQQAERLHEKRSAASDTISSELKLILNELKLPETQLTFHLNKRTQLNSSGLSDLAILFSANKGMTPVPVERAASGGELSRLMLALQKMISTKKQLPTVLFDEIDTGVSGEVAEKIGKLLKEMGSTMQLIAITHLPQVASKGSHHLKVEKVVNETSSVTHVKLLSESEREVEVARLMSGEQITEAAIHTARQLING